MLVVWSGPFATFGHIVTRYWKKIWWIIADIFWRWLSCRTLAAQYSKLVKLILVSHWGYIATQSH